MALDSEFQQGRDNEPTPAILHLAEDFRRRLGKLDPLQVAIWRQMTPARKLQLLFQLWSFALKVAWTTERQWHPELPQEELSRRVWRRVHGSEIPMFQPVSPHELENFFAYVVSVLERLGIPYMVVGGFAAITYGEIRFTADVDIVVDMRYDHVDPFVAAFTIPDYYVSREGILDSLDRRYPLNVIQPHSGAKVDLVPLSRDIRTRAAFGRRQRIVYDEVTGRAAYFATAEDTIVAKLHAHQETGSEKHLRDARGIAVTQWGRLNLDDVTRWARAAGVEETWLALLEAIGGE